MLVDLIVCWQSLMHYLTCILHIGLPCFYQQFRVNYYFHILIPVFPFSLALFLLSCIEEALVWIVTNTSSLPNFDKNEHQSIINVSDYYTVLSCNNKVINSSCIGNLAPVKFCLLRNAFCTFFFCWFTVDNNASVEVKTRIRILCFKKQREV